MKPKRLPELSENDITRYWSKVVQRGVDECWPWLGACKDAKRGTFGIKRKQKDRTFNAPRIAYALHYEYDPYPDDVLHNCNNANCVNPHHLRLGDDFDNHADSIAVGTWTHGEDVHFAKLTNKDVKAIKIAITKGAKNCDLAKQFDMDSSTISNIKRGKTWKHIKVPGFKPSTARRSA